MLLAFVGVVSACGSRTHRIQEVNVHDTPRVFFAFDRYDISEEARINLQGQALFMQNNPAVRITIEGHADERGTREYNLALGARRANAARNVLIAEGVEANRIRTVSYGKDRPWKLGTGESVWRYNRNATTVVRR
ncbi:MAG: peptidoglycan-associated lipoprotein Pal [Alphaproteobacteria bacterium]|nr:peptidoglycan-associated lipoprotein Pal [Alphaproteobacteria bacterium]